MPNKRVKLAARPAGRTIAVCAPVLIYEQSKHRCARLGGAPQLTREPLGGSGGAA